MGGSVFIGIRRSDKTEHLYECWTNSIPWLFADPDFITDGPGVDEFITNLEQSIASGHPLVRKHRSVTYSEYGVILIDHHTKKILSFQGYTHVGRMFASWHRGRPGSFPPNEAAIITRLNKAGRLLKLDDSSTKMEEINQEKAKEILRILSESTDGSLRVKTDLSIAVYTDLSDFDVVHSSNCARNEREIIKAFLIDNGWNARVRGQKRGKRGRH